MWKRLLKISEVRRQKTEVRSQTNRHTDKVCLLKVCLLSSVFCLLCSVSCAPKHVEMPSYEGVPLENALSELNNIKSIKAVLSVEYEKGTDTNGITMNGDASLNISEDKLNLRLYYLGFLAGEISEDNGIIKSKPKLDKNKSTILVEGLKNSFFWWNIKDYTLQEKEDMYVLKNSYRKIVISKKTLLPIQQTIELSNGEELRIFYASPAKNNSERPEGSPKSQRLFGVTVREPLDGQQSNSKSFWYNSAMTIEFKNYTVKIKVKSYTVNQL